MLRELKSSKAVMATEILGSLLAQLQVRSSLIAEIVRKQLEDSQLQKRLEKTKQSQETEFELRSDEAIGKVDYVFQVLEN